MRYTPIANDLFVNNRKRLVKELKPGSLAVLNANDIMPTTADGTMSFRQNSDLFYLTGVNQEESMLVICPDFPEKEARECLRMGTSVKSGLRVWGSIERRYNSASLCSGDHGKGNDRMSACVDIRFLFESTCLNLGETCASNFGHWIAVGR